MGESSDMDDSVDTGRGSSIKKGKQGGDGNLSSTLAFGMQQQEQQKACEFLYHNGTDDDKEYILARMREVAGGRGGGGSIAAGGGGSGGSGDSGGRSAAGGGGGMGRGRGIAEESPRVSRYCCETKRVRDYIYVCCLCDVKLCEEHVEYRSGQATASSSSSSSSSSNRVVRDYCELSADGV